MVKRKQRKMRNVFIPFTENDNLKTVSKRSNKYKWTSEPKYMTGNIHSKVGRKGQPKYKLQKPKKIAKPKKIVSPKRFRI